jgi:hypothetical protein
MLTTLSTAKARLSILDTDTTNDALLTAAIRAVSARFDLESNRTLARTENLVQEFPGDATELCATCYPIESISRFELKTTEPEGWIEQTNINYLLRQRCVVSLASPLGSWRNQSRVTYTGGYVLPGTPPSLGQTPLPPDLENAAIEQVGYWFQNRDRLGLSRLWEYHGTYRQIADLDLLSTVKAVLQRYVRRSA